MGITLRNGRSKGGKQRSKAPMMGAPEVVSTDGESSISTRTGGTSGSVFLKYVRALLIHDQHDTEARVWEEGAVEVPPECCQGAVASMPFGGHSNRPRKASLIRNDHSILRRTQRGLSGELGDWDRRKCTCQLLFANCHLLFFQNSHTFGFNSAATA